MISTNIKNLCNLLRCKQYIKNLFIFTPLIFSPKCWNIKDFILISIVFVGFSLITSFVYIINDIKDKEVDKLHPLKKIRAIASEKISTKKALFIAFLCLISGFTITLINTELLHVILVYIANVLLYTYLFKKIIVLDVLSISFGFILRLFVCRYAIDIYISGWIILLTFLLSLLLCFAKRYGNLRYKKLPTNIYNNKFLEWTIKLLSFAIIISYLLYSVSPSTIAKFNSNYIFLTSIFVIIGIFRYLKLTFVHKLSDSPTNIVYEDKIIKISLILWLFSFWLIIH